ncbi:hypothetical protein [Methylobacterium sp. 285MFTsu5.1]|uniref:rhamnosyltransferase WsaF family glycosyltransferase n=1 Tax=Methylobacterium sp. 285MFTsu5.1 TaxID=1172187 RepID=UPI0003A67F45|nr:hypothetical protein [Methylobacterium sp. 285MFTsu5.1]
MFIDKFQYFDSVLSKNSIFDFHFYQKQVKNVKFASLEDAKSHYDAVGYLEGLSPSPVFDTQFYRNNNDDVRSYNINPLDHFIKYGQYEGRRPTKNANPELSLNSRGREVRSRHRAHIDRTQYLAEAGFAGYSSIDIDPLMHYFAFGHSSQVTLSPEFDRQFYIETNADIREYNIDPVIHYLEYGYLEGRLSKPNDHWLRPSLSLTARAKLIRKFVDVDYYYEQLPWMANTTIDVALHYLIFGDVNSIAPNRWLNVKDLEQRFPMKGLITWLEIHLIAENTISQYGFHNHHAPKLGDFYSVNTEIILPDRDWRQIKSRNGFDINNVTGYKGQLPIKIKEDAKGINYGSDFINEIDDHFIEYILKSAGGGTLSCDIWDTVLRRKCHPDETKLRSARALWLLARSSNPDFDALHPVDLMQARRTAEAESADEVFEFRFEDMLSMWLRYFNLDKKYFHRRMEDVEKRVEMSSTFPDVNFAAILSRFAGRKIAVSDFYLGQVALKKILENNNINHFDEIYVSCDFGATKRQGDLYNIVKSREGHLEKPIMHVGDREIADVIKAREQGLRADLYNHAHHEERNHWLGAAFYSHLEGDFSNHALRLADIAGFDCHSSTTKVGSLALALCGFTMMIIEDSFKYQVEKVFFFSREGAFFKKIYEIATSCDVYDVGSYPEASMLYVSRRATFAPSLTSFSADQLMRLWSQYSTQSMAALAVSLNIDPSDWAAAAERHHIDLYEPIKYPWSHTGVLNFLNDGQIKTIGRSAIWQQRIDCLEYLEAAGFEPNRNINRLVVDIGWRGTIQDNISYICSGSIHGCYIGMEQPLNKQPYGVTKSGYLMDRPNGINFDFSEYAAIEFITNSEGGSVVGYENGRPIRQALEGEENCITQHVQPLQDELLGICQRVLSYMGQHGLTATDLRPLAQMAAQRYMQSPERRVADAFDALTHNETFGTGTSDEMSKADDLVALKKLAGYKLHYKSNLKFSEKRWINSFINSSRFSKLYETLSVEQRLSLARPSGIAPAPAIIRHRGRSVGIFAPHPIRGSGGHRTIYNFAKALARAGHKVNLFTEGRGEHFDYLEQEIEGYDIGIFDHWSSGIIPEAAVATIMHSTSYIERFFTGETKKFYLVQDFEAEFNSMSDAYIAGENSYTLGHTHLCVGNWLPHLIKQRFGGGAIGAGLGVDNTIYKPIANLERRNRIAVLYQPDKPRRMSATVLDALRLLKHRHPDVEFVTYGSDHRPNLPFDFEHLGQVNDLSALNALYNSAKIGICISLTNPSRIPFEMMAAGCVPIDVYRYNNLFDYVDGAGILAYQSAQSIAAASEHLLQNQSELERHRDRCLEIGCMRTLSWETDIHVNALEAVLRGQSLINLPLSAPTYKGEAFMSKADDTTAVRQFVGWQKALATKNG